MDELSGLVSTIASSVRGGQTLSQIRANLSTVLPQEALDRAIEIFTEQVGRIRTLKDPPTLVDPGLPSWYPGPADSDRFWPALRHYLSDEKKWPTDVVQAIDDSSTRVVSLLQPPGLGRVDSRGLVLGYVQSGKTASYTAVIAKAADVNYRLFIVLSGMHNALRAQTQHRLNRELVDLNPEYWLSLTSIESDFKELAGVRANPILTDKSHLKVLAVVKKNATVLNRLLRWLETTDREVISNCAAILIDDEADQASVNAASPEERTTINRLLLAIKRALPKVAYVGYTATPFANVLIDPNLEDLYPTDFIVNLPRSGTYFGPEQIFGRDPLTYQEDDVGADGLDMIRTVPDLEMPQLKPSGLKDYAEFVPSITASLDQAIRYFWLATAARWARGDIDEHSSMLIHTTLYADVHVRFEPLIHEFADQVLKQLDADVEEEWETFRTHWEEEKARVDWSLVGEEETDWSEIRPHLRPVIQACEVVVENSRSETRLEYGEDARVQIVVGGNTLSRGLTLEGLVVSFFIRASGAYDTLLQMGRWFGYRDGYADLPRIWMTEELRGHFRDLAMVEHEIRRDISRYEQEGLTPADLAVRIRVHPSLRVTSPLKMKAAAEVGTSYSGGRPQTIQFEHRDSAWLEKNLRATRGLMARLRSRGIHAETVSNGRHQLLRQVPVSEILQFIEEYAFHRENQTARSDLLLEYIRAQNLNGGLMTWSVGVIGRGVGPGDRRIDLGLESPVALVRRTRLKEPERSYAYVGAIMSDEDRAIDLQAGATRTPESGLLLIYPIDRNSQPRSRQRVPLEAVDDVIGVAFDFPDAVADTPVYKTVQPLLFPDAEVLDIPDEDDN